MSASPLADLEPRAFLIVAVNLAPTDARLPGAKRPSGARASVGFGTDSTGRRSPARGSDGRILSCERSTSVHLVRRGAVEGRAQSDRVVVGADDLDDQVRDVPVALRAQRRVEGHPIVHGGQSRAELRWQSLPIPLGEPDAL